MLQKKKPKHNLFYFFFQKSRKTQFGDWTAKNLVCYNEHYKFLWNTNYKIAALALNYDVGVDIFEN